MKSNLERIVTLFFLVAFSLPTPNAEAQSIVRGPYLQQGTPNSMIVRWRTDMAVPTRLEYGPSPTELVHRSALTPRSQDHEVQLSSLAPLTRYYYRIVTQGVTLVGGDSSYYFVTSPRGGDEPFRVWVVGDAGSSGAAPSGIDPRQIAVRDAFLKQHPIGDFQFFMMLGDNAYSYGTDLEYQRGAFIPYNAVMRSSVTWPTQGNHDIVANAYYKVFSLPKRGESGGVPSGTEFYYSFDYGNVHFISLNSEVVESSFRQGMLSWLRQDIGENNSEWTVAFWHHPPYSKGSHDSDYDPSSADRLKWMREEVLPILESAGVDLTLTGHSHSYERSKFVNGHYGVSSTFSPDNLVLPGNGGENEPYVKPVTGKMANKGTVHVVAGNGGQLHEGPLNHPAMAISLSKLGSLSLSFDANELVGTMIAADGAIDDRFIIRKGPNRPRVVKHVTATVDPSECRVEVKWDKGGEGNSFAVYRSSIPDGRGAIVGTLSPQQGVFHDSIKGLPFQEVTYSVRAKNTAGWGPWGEARRVVLPPGNQCL